MYFALFYRLTFYFILQVLLRTLFQCFPKLCDVFGKFIVPYWRGIDPSRPLTFFDIYNGATLEGSPGCIVCTHPDGSADVATTLTTGELVLRLVLNVEGSSIRSEHGHFLAEGVSYV
jgi:hypothetical protein